MIGTILGLVVGGSVSSTRAGAASTAERSPRATVGEFSNGSNALACDRIVAQATGSGQSQIFSLYGLSVPAGSIVTGIMVRVRANDGGEGNRYVEVSVSWDGGRRFSPALQTGTFERNAPLRDYVVGGSRVRWGHAWTAAELGDATFRVKLQSRMSGGAGGGAINVDCPPVTLFYEMPTPVPTPIEPTPEGADTTPAPTAPAP